MENVWENKVLVDELANGMELTKQLRIHMNSSSSVKTQQILLQKILSSYDKALLHLNCSSGQLQPVSPPAPAAAGLPESAISVDGSPRTEDFDYKGNREYRLVSKKRKGQPTWSEQVRACSENGIEGPVDDGYSWRKYGQKDILGAKFPRSYYRCTYRHMHSCWATKQVQRSDNDPCLFDITYRGNHTCNSNGGGPVLPSTSPPIQESKHPKIMQKPDELLLNFKNNLRVSTQDLDCNKNASPFTFPSNSPLICDNVMGGFSATISESNYYPVHYSESDFPDIISATTSSSNSPILDMDFSIEPLDFDHKFPFEIPGFFD